MADTILSRANPRRKPLHSDVATRDALQSEAFQEAMASVPTAEAGYAQRFDLATLPAPYGIKLSRKGDGERVGYLAGKAHRKGIRGSDRTIFETASRITGTPRTEGLDSKGRALFLKNPPVERLSGPTNRHIDREDVDTALHELTHQFLKTGAGALARKEGTLADPVPLSSIGGGEGVLLFNEELAVRLILRRKGYGTDEFVSQAIKGIKKVDGKMQRNKFDAEDAKRMLASPSINQRLDRLEELATGLTEAGNQ